MAPSLPRYVVLRSQSNAKFLQYVNKNNNDEKEGILKCDGDNITSPLVKLKIEAAKCGNGLVHILCCYTNKYLVSSTSTQGGSKDMIVAAADESEEDQSKPSCTLFKPKITSEKYYEDERPLMMLFHIYLQRYVTMQDDDDDEGPYNCCLFARSKEIPASFENMLVMDWESLLIMPKYVAFKDLEGKYLGVRDGHLKFVSKEKDDSVAFEISHSSNTNYIEIKSYFESNKYWAPEQPRTESKRITLKDHGDIFWPVKVNDKGNISLLVRDGKTSLDTRVFCNKTASGEFLEYTSKSTTKNSTFVVEELVLSRKIYNVGFHLLNARIYDEQVKTMATGVAINMSSEANEEELTIKYTDTKSSNWSANFSMGFGISTTIETGVPFIAEGKIEITANFQGGYEWGSTTEKSTEISNTFKVKVPSKSKVTLTVLATEGRCEIPFSYTKRDKLFNSKETIEDMIDGVYRATNSYNFKHQVKQENL